MKKILFIGNVNSFLILQLAKNLLECHPNWVIDILSPEKSLEEQTPFRNVLAVDNEHPNANKKIIKAFYVAFEMKKLLRRRQETYDIVHILYISSAYRYLWNQLKTLSPKIVLTVFGGDFYKANWIMKLHLSKMVKESAIVSATNPLTLIDFSNQFKVPGFKTKLVRFGLSILDEIDKVSPEDKKIWKEKHGINPSQITVACGYNGSPNQNLPAVLDSLKNFNSLSEKVILCFQLTEKSNHVEEIIKTVEKSAFDYILFRERFSDHALAQYRASMDIMIQVQTSDSFSGAMQEHLYAGSTVITGTWLPYEVLDELGIDYVKINDVTEVGEAVANNIHCKFNTSKNKEIIADLSKWSQTIDKWISLYD